ncbi:MAG: H-NS histone family protein [Bradyrhizobiaceae bacterium]|nr:H-NS histone family protein [Bradyrhizobiaceae bacterium]
MNLSSANLKSMSVDKLITLGRQVDAVLSTKVAEARRSVREQLSTIDRLIGGRSRVKGAGRGILRGTVPPKYCNPENPAETWAGRGLKPRWLVAAMKSGKKLEDFVIGAPVKRTRGRPKKARA